MLLAPKMVDNRDITKFTKRINTNIESVLKTFLLNKSFRDNQYATKGFFDLKNNAGI